MLPVTGFWLSLSFSIYNRLLRSDLKDSLDTRTMYFPPRGVAALLLVLLVGVCGLEGSRAPPCVRVSSSAMEKALGDDCALRDCSTLRLRGGGAHDEGGDVRRAKMCKIFVTYCGA